MMKLNKYTDITFYRANAIYWEDYEYERQSWEAKESSEMTWLRIS